eukprot:1794004-Pleurochrysis_carterae.AAC.1
MWSIAHAGVVSRAWRRAAGTCPSPSAPPHCVSHCDATSSPSSSLKGESLLFRPSAPASGSNAGED